jgi:hypothetical protein
MARSHGWWHANKVLPACGRAQNGKTDKRLIALQIDFKQATLAARITVSVKGYRGGLSQKCVIPHSLEQYSPQLSIRLAKHLGGRNGLRMKCHPLVNRHTPPTKLRIAS